MAEDFLWAALYSDGEQLIEENGIGFATVDQSRLAAFALIPQRDHLPAPVLELNEGMRPIFFRRRRFEKSLETGEETPLPAVTVLGWQATINGRNVKSLCAFFHDGSIKLTDDDGSF